MSMRGMEGNDLHLPCCEACGRTVLQVSFWSRLCHDCSRRKKGKPPLKKNETDLWGGIEWFKSCAAFFGIPLLIAILLITIANATGR